MCNSIMSARVMSLCSYYLRFTIASLLVAYISDKALL